MLFQVGSLNTAALAAPGEYVQIVPPTTRYINGVPTNILGYVGTASWGPVNAPVLIGSPQDQATYLGNPNVRASDLSTAVSLALQLGQSNIRTVRVTDGTDTAATIPLVDIAVTPVTGITLTAVYTGTVGNSITASIAAGTKASSYKLLISRPGYTSETYDNITGTGLALWQNMVAAVNNGNSAARGPSQLVIATVGTSTTTPNLVNNYTLAGGTDGVTTITGATLVGLDTGTRKGMYALRGTGVQTATLVDHTDSTAWGTIATFGAQEGIFFGVQAASGNNYAATSALLNTAGADSAWLKVFVGDWVIWSDPVNTTQRLLGPATAWAALRASLAPYQSTLNKPVLPIVGTTRAAQSQPYSQAELGAAATARLDYLANPSAGGNYFSYQTDRNSSSDPNVNSEAYTTMTNFLALTLAQAFGFAIGQPQTASLRTTVQNSIQSFLLNLWKPGSGPSMIGDPNAPQAVPYSVQINASNNPNSQVALGYMSAYVKVKYLSIVRYFIVSLEGGSSVNVTVSATAPF